MRNALSIVFSVMLMVIALAAICEGVMIRASAQSPVTFANLPTTATPPASSYLMLDNGGFLLSKATVANVVAAGVTSAIPNAPSPEPSCVVSAGSCTVNVPITGGAVHECSGNTDSGDTNGPFVVEGAPSPGPSAGWQFTVTQVTPTSTPTVHIHAVCR